MFFKNINGTLGERWGGGDGGQMVTRPGSLCLSQAIPIYITSRLLLLPELSIVYSRPLRPQDMDRKIEREKRKERPKMIKKTNWMEEKHVKRFIKKEHNIWQKRLKLLRGRMLSTENTVFAKGFGQFRHLKMYEFISTHFKEILHKHTFQAFFFFLKKNKAV